MDLLEVMARLRAADGCAWDRAQTHESLKRYAVEEVYEVIEAIDQGDDDALLEELGDLLFQVVFHAQIASEEGRFDFHDVWAHAAEKMVRRHPHVFAKDGSAASWEAIKQAEGPRPKGYLAPLPKEMPALMQAEKTLKKAARAGFPIGSAPSLTEAIEDMAEGKQEALAEALIALLAGSTADDPEALLKARLRRLWADYAVYEEGSPFFFEALAPEEAEKLWQSLWKDEKNR